MNIKRKKISNGVKYPHTNFKHDLIKSENKGRSGYACLFKPIKFDGKIGRGASPNFNEEKKFWKKGFKFVVGIDEAGRGSLAGPVVAGAVAINFKFKILNLKLIFNEPIFKKVRDSKMLSAKQREEIYNALIKHPNIKWGIGIVSEKIIDKINILEATKLAMLKAVKDLEKKLRKPSVQKTHDREFSAQLVLVIDGNIKLDESAFAKSFSEVKQKSIIKADQKVFSCALASIFAKVTRDAIMQKLHKKYPEYGFDIHKGYGTSHHFKMLKKHGVCKIHRKSFYPVSNIA